ncbi:carboxylate-amine ligase [Tengunoibacter tsumagoiensis]|uniref:Putative glutamate--cysteine ligase 2 n=1 Tax=Tengunoibacter tsumagoiensis TaxID=2014871 RepID=A0A401ZWN1_9CHLR|nr:carboxylate-amine ligase [Tengunoibacter tsumagoiensis]GCE11190.1 putative glutamate--cysteine ligase 2 [Tengunoibacter tsumagoiensis]
MLSRFTLGIEEEFQMVDKQTGQLASQVHTIIEQGLPFFGEQIKPEMLQSMVEIITNVCPNITALRLDLQQKTQKLAQLVDAQGLALISAGTHPLAHWRDQKRSRHIRYEELDEEFQDVGRSILICGLHVHVGIDRHELAVPLMNQLRTWLPHLLALSSNSPFWIGHHTGIKSYRAVVWKRFPRSGIPNPFSSTLEYDRYVQNLVQTGCIDNAKKIWWDIRPHPFYNTIEFRVCDMPATIEDAIAIAALCQALVAKLTWLYEKNITTYVLSDHYIEENKWRAARYGLDAEVVDFIQGRRLSMRDAIHEVLDFVEDVVDELNIRREMSYLRALLVSSQGTGADRQLAIYQETQDLSAVITYLTHRTMEGLLFEQAS